MAMIQNFRSAFNGFNREDVVRYIEYMNNKHASQVNQLKTELQTQNEELNGAQKRLEQTERLRMQVEEAAAERERLEQELVQVRADLTQEQATQAALQQEIAALKDALEEAKTSAARVQTELELEAYRRAERAERVAGERVARLYDQANGALAEVTVCTDEMSEKITEAAQKLADQLEELQAAIAEGKQAMAGAAASLRVLSPSEVEE